jgi:hypothetical protein
MPTRRRSQRECGEYKRSETHPQKSLVNQRRVSVVSLVSTPPVQLRKEGIQYSLRPLGQLTHSPDSPGRFGRRESFPASSRRTEFRRSRELVFDSSGPAARRRLPNLPFVCGPQDPLCPRESAGAGASELRGDAEGVDGNEASDGKPTRWARHRGIRSRRNHHEVKKKSGDRCRTTR